MLTEFVYAALAILSLLYGIDFLFGLGDDPKEPRRVRPWIPIFGHLIGLIQDSLLYYNKLGPHIKSEFYTLGIGTFKIYVVNARRLIQPVQRASKTLVFNKTIQMSAKNLLATSKYTVDLFGNPEFLHELDASIRTTLSPGPFLDDQNLRTGVSLLKQINEVVQKSGETENIEVNFYAWERRMISLATAAGIYGHKHNPWDDPTMYDDFWTWSDAAFPMAVGMPNIFMRKNVQARERMVKAHISFVENIPDDCSELIKERLRISKEWGANVDDRARIAASFDIAALGNTAPTAFWTMFSIFSDEKILADLRREVETASIIRDPGNKTYELDIASLKQRCPHLLSVMEEVQRMRHVHANIRTVLKDTYLDNGRYLVKEGAILQMPNMPVHMSKDVWGPDAQKYQPYRFVSLLKSKYERSKEDGVETGAHSNGISEANEKAKHIPTHAYLAWGVAPNLCPGRQFASTEILVLVALMILRLEIRPVFGKWTVPDGLPGQLTAIMPPKQPVRVFVSSRKGWNEGEWSLKMGGSMSRVPLASG